MLKIRKANDSFMNTAKAELKRLSNAYFENAALSPPEADSEEPCEMNPVNWELIINSQSRPSRESVIARDKPKHVMSSSKRRSFKVKPKEIIKAEPMKHSTMEFNEKNADIEQDLNISKEFNDIVSKQCITEKSNEQSFVQPVCELNNSQLVKDIRNKPEIANKLSESIALQIESESPLKDEGIRCRSICKKPQGLVIQPSVNQRVSAHKIFRRINIDRYDLAGKQMVIGII